MHKTQLRLRGWMTLVAVLAASGGASTAFAAVGLKVLVLPAATGGYLPKRAMWREEYAARVAQEVRQGRHQALEPLGRLSTEEEACVDERCAVELMTRLGADAIIAASVLAHEVPGAAAPDGAAPAYRVSVWLRDRARSGALVERSQVCGTCTEIQAAELVSQLGRQVVVAWDASLREITGSTGTAAVAAQPAATEGTAITAGGRQERVATAPSRRRTLLRALGFTSLALAVGSLGLLGYEAGVHGNCDDALCRRNVDATAGIATGATLTAVFGTAAGLLLWWGFSK